MDERGRRFPPPFSVRAVLFDLDGTLIDTAPDLALAVNLTLGDLGFPGVELPRVRSFIGNGVRELMRRSLGRFREPSEPELDEALAIFTRHYGAHLADSSRLYPAVTGVLSGLRARGLALGCVTNKIEVFTTALLDGFGLSRYFGVVLSGDSLPKKKPDPLPFIHAGRLLLEAPPEQALVVGDSSNDVVAARAAGMPVVCVSYGYRLEPTVHDLGADAAIDALSELPDLLTARRRV